MRVVLEQADPEPVELNGPLISDRSRELNESKTRAIRVGPQLGRKIGFALLDRVETVTHDANGAGVWDGCELDALVVERLKLEGGDAQPTKAAIVHVGGQGHAEPVQGPCILGLDPDGGHPGTVGYAYRRAEKNQETDTQYR